MADEQLRELARRTPAEYIHPPPKGKFGDYVSHDVITQRLLYAVGPFSFDIRTIIRGGEPPLIVGCIARLTVEVDGRTVYVDEVGDVENPATKKTDGERLKDASSDAIKRCAMRLGLGLHLWSQKEYFLDAALAKREAPEKPEKPREPEKVSAPQPASDEAKGTIVELLAALPEGERQAANETLENSGGAGWLDKLTAEQASKAIGWLRRRHDALREQVEA